MNAAQSFLEADQKQIAQFVDALFRHARQGAAVSLRAFRHDNKPFGHASPVTINGGGLGPVTAAASRMATSAARSAEPVVFCPPVATFDPRSGRARERDLAEGLALSVECDRAPGVARERLEELLGPATVVVESGGEWTDEETGEVQPKLHLHWRLAAPTGSPEDHAELKRARALATTLVGGDGTNVPLVHPIRWPGSWHRKGDPRMARIASLDDGAEIDLSDALAKLEAAASDGGVGGSAAEQSGMSRKTRDDYRRLVRGLWTDGQKHAAVRDVAASLAAQGVRREFVEALIAEACPVWDENVERSIDSAYCKYAPEADEHPPVDLWGSFLAPELPTGLIPPVIERFARDRARIGGCDTGGVAMAALTVCAAAVSDEIQVQVKEHDSQWRESARIWTALVGDPSTKKSPILGIAAAPLKRIDYELHRTFVAERKAYDARDKAERVRTPAPLNRRRRLEDTTVEAAEEVLADSPDGVLLLQDELSGWFGAMDKYSGGRGAAKDRGFWLQTFNGGQYARNRVGRGTALVPNLSCSLLGGIQPDPIRRLAADAVDDGLIQRLLPIVLTPATQGHDLPPDGDAVSGYERTVAALVSMPPGPGPLRFSPQAQEIRRQAERRHLELAGLDGINRKLAAHCGKLDGIFARLCVLFHSVELVEWRCEPGVVDAELAGRVDAFMRTYLLPHALAFYGGVLGLSDDHDRLTAIAGYILAHRLPEVTRRGINRSVRSMRGMTERETVAILEQLEAFGWLDRLAPVRAGGAPRWRVREVVHVAFAERARAEASRRKKLHQSIRELLPSAARN